MGRNQLKREIFKEIVSENGGTIQETEQIVESALAFTKKTFEQGEFDTVRHPYFGKFFVNPKRLKMLNHAILQRRKPPGIS